MSALSSGRRSNQEHCGDETDKDDGDELLQKIATQH
jgi:hypothetical protein